MPAGDGRERCDGHPAVGDDVTGTGRRKGRIGLSFRSGEEEPGGGVDVVLEGVGGRYPLRDEGDPVAVVPPGHDAVGVRRVGEVVLLVGGVVVHAEVGGVRVHPLEGVPPVVGKHGTGDAVLRVADVFCGRGPDEDDSERDGERDGADLRDGDRLLSLLLSFRLPEICDRLPEPKSKRPRDEDRRKERKVHGQVILEPEVLDGRDEDDDRPDDGKEEFGAVFAPGPESEHRKSCRDEEETDVEALPRECGVPGPHLPDGGGRHVLSEERHEPVRHRPPDGGEVEEGDRGDGECRERGQVLAPPPPEGHGDPGKEGGRSDQEEVGVDVGDGVERERHRVDHEPR